MENRISLKFNFSKLKNLMEKVLNFLDLISSILNKILIRGLWLDQI